MNLVVPDPLRVSTVDLLGGGMPAEAKRFPEWRYMGSKKRLLPWIHGVLEKLDFETALDPFSGSGSVGYLMKAMGRRVTATDFLNVSATIATALIENSEATVGAMAMRKLTAKAPRANDFIARTFTGPRAPNGVEVVNVLGFQAGEDPKRVVIVQGHIDSRVSDPLNFTADAPGANDDASGVALVIEAARILSKQKHRATIIYAALSGEEQGLWGGTLLAETAKERGWRAMGIEPSRQAAAHARELGLDVTEGFFNAETAPTLGQFDVVHLNNVLEHVPSPADS